MFTSMIKLFLFVRSVIHFTRKFTPTKPRKLKLPHRKLHHEGVHNAAEDGDEVEGVPPIPEVALKKNY